MHGLILMELGKYANEALGKGAWQRLRKECGLEGDLYLPTLDYPEPEGSALFAAVSRATGKPLAELQEDLGEYASRELLDFFRPFMRPDWKTLDLVAHYKEVNSKVYRRLAGARHEVVPPNVRSIRVSAEESVITYESDRRICGFLRGMFRGIGRHLGEAVWIEDQNCVLDGDSACTFSVRLSRKKEPLSAR